MFSQNQEEVKLEWMYKGAHSTVNREEYLLGRSIDKTLEHINLEEKQQQLGVQQPKNHVEHECIPPSIRNYQEQLGEQVDINAKLQEDPLIAIRKREEENRRQFLNNPVQIKKLQKALKLQKSKKKKKQIDSDDDSNEDLDKKLLKKLKSFKSGNTSTSLESKKPKANKAMDIILMHKYNQLKNQLTRDDIQDILQGKISSSSSSNSSSDSEHNEEDSDNKTRKKKFKGKFNSNYNKRVRRSRSQERHEYKKKSSIKNRSRSRSYERKGHENSKSNKKRKGRSSSREKCQKSFRRHRSSSDNSDSDSNYSKRKNNYGLVKADGTKILLTSKQGTSSHSKLYQSRKVESTTTPNLPKRSTLTEKEKEKRRYEMMQNATWRDSERAKNIKYYREKDLKEARAQEDYDPKFLQKQLLKSANSSSVESRIKANINNIQRSKNDMNKHFSKR